MENLEMKLDLTVNGAVVVPTPEQFEAIKQSAVNLVFGRQIKKVTVPEETSHIPRHYTRRRHRVEWSPAEDAALSRMRSDFPRKSWEQIARSLYREFGTKRSVHALTLRYGRKLNPKRFSAVKVNVQHPTEKLDIDDVLNNV